MTNKERYYYTRSEIINHLTNSLIHTYNEDFKNDYRACYHYQSALDILELWNKLHARTTINFIYCFEYAKSGFDERVHPITAANFADDISKIRKSLS